MQGAIGEILLERLLKDILPSGTYKMQYAIAPELRPDAVIKLQDKYIPIDSKFPLSLYSRWQQENNENEKQALYKQLIKEIKMHIESVAKYVDAGLNTYDFAFMYIPAEAIYYEVFVRQNRQDIINFATAKRVIPVSPNTFYAYLQSILYGLRGLEIEKKAEEILQHISSMREDFSKLEEHMSKGEQYLTWASRHLAFIYRIINQLSIKLDSLSKLNSSN
jgi:DNA recombination protein RmuC